MGENISTKEDKRILIMRDEKPRKAVIVMSIPVIIGMLVMVLYNLVDTYFIGRLNDPIKLAAANLSMPAMMICVAIASMVGTGAASYIARSLGADKKERADATLVISIAILFIFSLFISVFGILFLDKFVEMLGANKDTSFYTKEYVRVLLIGTLFIMSNYALGQLLRAEGSTKLAMFGMLLGTVINIILDPIFIFTLKLGVKGAAIATVLGNILGTLYCIICYLKKKTLLSINLKLLSFDKEILKEIFYVGLPATLEQLLTIGAIVVNNNLAATYGYMTVAAMGITSKVMSIGNYIYMGFAAGSQPLMGYNYGAKNLKRVKDLVKASVSTVSFVEIFVMIIFGVFAPQIIGIFTSDQEVIKIGAIILRALMFNLPFVGATSISRITFQSMGKPMPALIITICRQGVLYIPLLILLNKFVGFNGFIYAQPITEVIMMVISVTFLLRVIKKENKVDTIN